MLELTDTILTTVVLYNHKKRVTKRGKAGQWKQHIVIFICNLELSQGR